MYVFYSDLFDNNVHLRTHHLREDGYVPVLPSDVRHVKNRTAHGPDRIRPEWTCKHPLPTAVITTSLAVFFFLFPLTPSHILIFLAHSLFSLSFHPFTYQL